MSTALTFQDTTFDVVDHNNQPWLRLYQIGSALGYDKPEVSVSQLYSRHADEFTSAMTAVVKLPTSGGEQCTRIFSLRGCHLLAMLARTPVAKAFRKWVLDVLDSLDKPHPQPEQPALPPLDAPITPDQQCTLHALVKARIDAVPESERSNTLYPQIWARFKNHFRIAKYSQLPQTRLSEAIDYLAKVDLKIGKKKAQAALPDTPPKVEQTPAQTPVNSIPALPEDQYPEQAKDTMKLLEKIQRELHEVRVVSSVRSLPASKTLGDQKDGERFSIEENLYHMVDGLLFSAWHAVKAGARIRSWKG